MGKRKGSYRRKCRKILMKHPRERGKLSLSRFFGEFKEGQKVVLAVESSFHRGVYNMRFHGKVGTVLGKRGRSYEVKIRDGNSEKLVVVHPVHLEAL